MANLTLNIGASCVRFDEDKDRHKDVAKITNNNDSKSA